MNGIIITLIVIVLLLVFSSILSGSETALTATSRARMMKLAEEGTRRARWVTWLLIEHERFLIAILLSNNLVNILASALATQLFLRLFGDAGVVYATITMTVLIVILAEVLPKTYAILTPDQTALRVSILIRPLVLMLAPLTGLIQIISRGVLRLAGFTDASAGRLLPPHEEIRSTIELQHQEGGVVKHERDMLGGILDLQRIDVSEVMVHRKNITMIDADLPNKSIVQQAVDSQFSRIPLWREAHENIIGVLHVRSLLRALKNHKFDITKVDIVALITPPWFIPETTPLIEQLNRFRERKEHFAFVVDEYGVLMGLITIEDIIEEIVGHIDDEHDIPELGIKHLADGGIEVIGTTSIRDLNREMGWRLPDDEATTIAGLIIHEARTIPDSGQVFDYYGYRFHITARHRNQIAQVRIFPTLQKKPRRR